MSARLSIARLLALLVLSVLATGLARQSTAIRSFARYQSGDFTGAVDESIRDGGLDKASRELRSRGRQWIEAASSAERSRRLAVVAAMSTELLARGVVGTQVEYGHVRPLVEWMCKLFQGTPSSEFERWHHLATIALLQAAGDSWLLLGPRWGSDPVKDSHIQHAVQRFPRESRIAFARVQSLPDLRLIASRPSSTVEFLYGSSRRSPQEAEEARRIRDTISHLDKLAGDALVGDEVVLRRGVLQFMFGNTPASLGDLQRSSTSSDPFIQYLGYLMLGVVYEQTGESPAAIGSYSSALRVIPGTAATIALSNALFLTGRRAEADELLRNWNRTTTDPWREYEAGSYRHFPKYLAELRTIATSAKQ